jgi:hypothetical protein
MKLPIGAIARFALKRIVLPAIGKAIASESNPLTKEVALREVQDAVRAEAVRQIGKRAF